MGFLIRLYVNALFKGNPFVVGITLIGLVALSLGPFSQALSSKDPMAIGVVVLIVVGLAIVMAVAIIDRKNNAPKEKKRPPARSGRR